MLGKQTDKWIIVKAKYSKLKLIQQFYRCADITNLPLGCTQVKKAADCCPTIQCSNGQTGTFQGSQTQPGTIGGYPIPQPQPGVAPTPGTGLTVGPGPQPTVNPNTGHAIGTEEISRTNIRFTYQQSEDKQTNKQKRFNYCHCNNNTRGPLVL